MDGKKPTEAELAEMRLKEREAIRKGAYEQAQKCVAFVKEATDLAKTSGREVDEVLTEMMIVRFEELRSERFLAETIANTFVEARERVLLLRQGLLKNPPKDGNDVVVRLGQLAGNLQRSADTAATSAAQIKKDSDEKPKQTETAGNA